MDLTVGRIVHYVREIPDGDGVRRECRAAIIVRVFDDRANLQEFIDGKNDDPAGDGVHVLAVWRTSVAQSDEAIGGTFHDPRECPDAPKSKPVKSGSVKES